MRPARLRHRLAWLLVLVLSAGLACPALASVPTTEVPANPAVTHIHADGSAHAHAAGASDGAGRAHDAVRPDKPPHRCLGCMSAASCAVSCFGVGVLPVPFLLQVTAPRPHAWANAVLASPAGIDPPGEIDPPKSSPVR